MNLSNVRFDPALPYWQDVLSFLNRLSGHGFPSCAQLNALLPDGLCSAGGQAIRFVDSSELCEAGYEHRIYTTGQVSTRPDSWHDLFNAMIWMRFPRIKVAMNSLHYHAGASSKRGSRGQLRDALTLFDECGVLVFSSKLETLQSLAERRWMEAFSSDAFRTSVGLSICGHAMLEKFMAPYKAMTAKALFIHVDHGFMELTRAEKIDLLDREIAFQLIDGQILGKPACLSPLPLAGVPGYWPGAEQNKKDFYNDLQVFRPPPQGFTPVTISNFRVGGKDREAG